MPWRLASTACAQTHNGGDGPRLQLKASPQPALGLLRAPEQLALLMLEVVLLTAGGS